MASASSTTASTWKLGRSRRLRLHSEPASPESTGITAPGSAMRCTWRCKAACLSSHRRPDRVGRMRTILRLGLAAAFAASLAVPALAERIMVSPGDVPQDVVDGAADGDVVVLKAGEHRGAIRIARKVTVEGEPGAILVGPGKGSVIRVLAPEAVVRGLTIRGSGRDLETMDSGVFIEKTAVGAVIEKNRVEDNLYGVYIHGARNAVVRQNEIVGIRAGRMNDAGNGVSVWDAPGAKVLDNSFQFGRDGIFSVASSKNVFSGNRFRDLRFAVHYMYTNDGEVTNNLSANNTVGY